MYCFLDVSLTFYSKISFKCLTCCFSGFTKEPDKPYICQGDLKKAVGLKGMGRREDAGNCGRILIYFTGSTGYTFDFLGTGMEKGLEEGMSDCGYTHDEDLRLSLPQSCGPFPPQ